MSEIHVELDQKVVGLTPAILAKAFWAMEDTQQAKFFDELAKVIEADHVKNPSSYSYGELQWCYLKDVLRRPGMERANKMHMALSAFAFDFWSRKPDGAREGL
ncbi:MULTISPECIES: hypothetical protein [Pseudomonas]|uniref:Uncharacterized protein n=1 Tax=Pseudomonas putida TaxID=303 RepID=A0A1L7NEU4_PSEPU|nr:MULTISPECIES: hypothetical protein [Pseudomonas]MBP2091729.1 hypothetical protein [Pseudomonas sp. PvP088]MBP2222108.1 hypothetical protein [Pseudomonas putida]PMY81838.1 hypothetical protein C1X72_07520 [Pseudomonas sp. FW306-2-2C-D06B]BAW23996.1 Uncharacterized protein KF715C_ch34230 [Pseudomonas putida]